MSEKKKVYVETTVVSDATALPARDVVQLGRQVVTREWWSTAAQRFDLYSSLVVAKEVRAGDPEAARRRVAALEGIPELDVSEAEQLLARKLIDGKAVPKEYPDDALHIAVAAVQRRYDEGLEEIWRIKREIAAEYPTLDDYFKGMMAYQEEQKRQGVRFVRFPPKRPEHAMEHCQ